MLKLKGMLTNNLLQNSSSQAGEALISLVHTLVDSIFQDRKVEKSDLELGF